MTSNQASKKESRSKRVDFAKELQELEAIVAWFESGDVDLDEALSKFERGMELSARLKDHLQTVANKVEVIKKKFETSDGPKAPKSESAASAKQSESGELFS